MHLLYVLVVGLFTFFASNATALTLAERQLGIADIPPCAHSCLILSLPSSNCSLVDIECQCRSEELSRLNAACMLANCTMADSLGSAKVQAKLCNLSTESRAHQIALVSNIVFSISVLCVVLRVTSKLVTKRLSSDDYLIIGAFVFATTAYGGSQSMIRSGFGKHLWSLENGQLKAALQSFFISWNAYVITLGLVKMSLVTFYLQIFQSRGFRIICFIVLGYIFISTIVMLFLTIFSCLPVQSFWDRDIKGRCLDVNAVGYANSANAILQDLIILLLPISSLIGLQMKRWRKVAVGLMLAVGAFGCITTIIRLNTLLSFKIALDPTWDYNDVVIWTALELASGIICASLPSIRILFATLLRRSRSNLTTSRSRSRSATTPFSGPHNSPNSRQREEFALLDTPSASNLDVKISGVDFTSINQVWTSRSSDLAAQTNTSCHVASSVSGRHSYPSILPLRYERSSSSFIASFWSSIRRFSSQSLTHSFADTQNSIDGFGSIPIQTPFPDDYQNKHALDVLKPLPRALEPCHFTQDKDYGRMIITTLPTIQSQADRSKQLSYTE